MIPVVSQFEFSFPWLPTIRHNMVSVSQRAGNDWIHTCGVYILLDKPKLWANMAHSLQDDQPQYI